MESTTVKVSKQTARKLSSLQRSLKIKSLDETVDLLVKQHRKELIEKAFGADRGKIRPFGEDDRGEDSS
ncbi:MAG: VapB-type antitoxin [Thaumarchaeota archaeon]|nr:VapB-type antitoxin [Nitrososphaerota archaeon]